MLKVSRAAAITPHKPIEKLEDNLWVVQSGPPGRSSGSRRMAIARLQNGDLVFYNAVPLEEPAMKQLTDWGRPAFLILPSNLHMMDGHAFAQRLNLKVYGPKRDTKMQARVKVEGGLEDFVSDGTVKVSEVAGSKNGEAATAGSRAR